MTRKRMPLALAFATVGLIISAFAASGSADSPAKGEVTFSKDVAPIFFKSCVECHRPNEAAPMSLLSYKEARPWARSIKEKVVTREMPPWHADPHVGEFSNDRRLSQKEIDTIVAWADSGAKEGDPKDLPPQPEFPDGWAIGKPDLVLQFPEEITLDASGPDEYHNIEIPTNFKEERYVQMAEARPGNRRVVHHMTVFIRTAPPQNALKQFLSQKSIFRMEGTLTRMKEGIPVYDDGCALANGGRGLTLDTSQELETGDRLTVYTPGRNPEILEPGIVKRIPAGAKIVVQIHYSKVTGKVEKDRSMIGLVFAKEPPDKHLFTQGVANMYFSIPPGAENHRVTACWTTKEDIHLHTFYPHMHLRGKAMEYKVFYPDGRSEVLLNVPNYNFFWQTVYYLKKPVALPKGTKIVVTGYFDNSAKNKYNPDPKQTVRYGDPSYDDMLIGWLTYTVDSQHLKDEVVVNKK
jgi:mono/diheme cytochrome c family protein